MFNNRYGYSLKESHIRILYICVQTSSPVLLPSHIISISAFYGFGFNNSNIYSFLNQFVELGFLAIYPHKKRLYTVTHLGIQSLTQFESILSALRKDK
jgi:hypothetical protein